MRKSVRVNTLVLSQPFAYDSDIVGIKVEDGQEEGYLGQGETVSEYPIGSVDQRCRVSSPGLENDHGDSVETEESNEFELIHADRADLSIQEITSSPRKRSPSIDANERNDKEIAKTNDEATIRLCADLGTRFQTQINNLQSLVKSTSVSITSLIAEASEKRKRAEEDEKQVLKKVQKIQEHQTKFLEFGI